MQISTAPPSMLMHHVWCRIMTKLLDAVEAHIDDFELPQLKAVWWALGKLRVLPHRSFIEAYIVRWATVLVDLDAMVRR